jgi:7-cyano-7-deazaguanine synthase
VFATKSVCGCPVAFTVRFLAAGPRYVGAVPPEAATAAGPISDPAAAGRVVVLLSGGVDSTTAAAVLTRGVAERQGLFIDYGQLARVEERSAAAAIADALDLPLEIIRCRLNFPNLLGEIVGRNALLLHLALASVGRGPATIVIATHSGTGYADCSSEFIELMSDVFDFHTHGSVQLLAPFVNVSKLEIWDLAIEAGTPLQLTYSCERAEGPCGNCRSCRDREALSARA